MHSLFMQVLMFDSDHISDLLTDGFIAILTEVVQTSRNQNSVAFKLFNADSCVANFLVLMDYVKVLSLFIKTFISRFGLFQYLFLPHV